MRGSSERKLGRLGSYKVGGSTRRGASGDRAGLMDLFVGVWGVYL